MPQPAELNALVDELTRLFTAAQDEITRLAARAATDPNRARQLSRARAMQAAVDDELRQLEQHTADWISSGFPRAYELGGEQGAAVLDGPFTWNQIHVEAVRTLAEDAFADVLAATTQVRDDVKAWIREQGRRQTALSLIEGRTAEQAARELARAASGDAVEALGGPVGMIQYADGSYRRMDDYADMLLRTKTAVCFNAGTLNTLGQGGVRYVEVFDGVGCGWTQHLDGDQANGSIRRLQDALEHPLSHPRCRRSFGGRPDIRTKNEAASAEPSTSSAQRADQAKAERDRAKGVARRREARAKREARAQRPQRQPRQARTARKPKVSTPSRPTWTDQPSVAAVNKQLTSMLNSPDLAPIKRSDGTVHVDFKGMDVRGANAAARAFLDAATRHPETARHIGVIGSSAGVTPQIDLALRARGRRMPRMGRQYADAAKEAGSIRFAGNKATRAKYDQLIADFQREVGAHWRPPGTGSVEGVIYHEFGHHIDFLARENARDAVTGVSRDYLNRLRAIYDEELAGLTRAERAEALSQYAMKNQQELVAEAVSEVLSNPPGRARRFAQRVYDLVVEFAERTSP